MKTETPFLSDEFQRLYCDAKIFEGFSVLHPVSFSRVLPFQADDPMVDNPRLRAAEEALLANSSYATRLAVVEAFGECGLLPVEDVANLKQVIDYFDTDFFELMGEVYANAGMFICALRWHREFVAELETRRPNAASDRESVYASVGYCLYSLGLYAEAVAWSKSCIGPRQMADTVFRELIDYEAQLQGGCVRGIERSGDRTRYCASAFDSAQANQLTPRLKLAMNSFAPFEEVYIDWLSSEKPMPEIQPEGYPFQAERDSGALVRHRMNLIFSLGGQADELIGRGYNLEAKRLLIEAAMLEPAAGFIQERIKTVV